MNTAWGREYKAVKTSSCDKHNIVSDTAGSVALTFHPGHIKVIDNTKQDGLFNSYKSSTVIASPAKQLMLCSAYDFGDMTG